MFVYKFRHLSDTSFASHHMLKPSMADTTGRSEIPKPPKDMEDENKY